MPSLHGTPLQQSPSAEHCCPNAAHGVPESPASPASPASTPPSGSGPQGPQTPCVLPGGTSHISPGQQSAVMVHVPHFGTHPWKQMNGGMPPSTGLGTHGTPLQQFALVAHAPPASTHGPVQRGTPTLSGLQVSSF